MLLQDGGQCNKNYARRVVRCPPKKRCEVISAVAGHRMRFWPSGRILCPRIGRKPAFLGHRMRFSLAARILCPAPAAERQPPQCNKPAGRRATAMAEQPVGRRPPAAAWRRANAKKASSRRNWLLCLVEFPGQAGNDAWITPRDGHGVRHGRHRDGRHGHRGGHHDGHRAGGVRHHGAHRLHPGQRR